MKDSVKRKSVRRILLPIIIFLLVIISILSAFIFWCVPDNEDFNNRFAESLEDEIQGYIDNKMKRIEYNDSGTFNVSYISEYHQSNDLSDDIQKYLNAMYGGERYFVIVEDYKVKKVICGGMGWGESYGSYPVEPESEHRNGILPVSFKEKVEREIENINNNSN